MQINELQGIRRNPNHTSYAPEIYTSEGENHLLLIERLLYAGSAIGILLYLIFQNTTGRWKNKAQKEKTVYCQSHHKNLNQGFWVRPRVLCTRLPHCHFEQLHPWEGWMMVICLSCSHKRIKFVKTPVYELQKLEDICILKEFEWEV